MAKNIDSTVRRLLQNRDNRNSDKKLLLAFWAEEGFHLSESQREAFMSCTTAESITRARRKAKEDGVIGDAEVEQKRYELFEQERNERSEGVKWYRG